MATFCTYKSLWQVSTLPAAPIEDYSILVTASLELTTLLNSFYMTMIMDYDISKGNFNTSNMDYLIEHYLKQYIIP